MLLAPLSVQATTSTAPQAKTFDLSGRLKSDFVFFEKDYSGGTALALGDINGDGLKEIILCSGTGHKAIVRSYSAYGVTKDELQAYGDNFFGGCYVASADVNGDGQDEVITGAGYGGGPQVRIFEIGKELKNFFAYSDRLRQGVRVLATDLGNDGQAEIIAFSNLNSKAEYAIFGNDGHLIGANKLKNVSGNGLSLAVGDFDGNGQKEFAVAGGFGSKSEIFLYDLAGKLLKTVYYDKSEYLGGLNLSAGDVNGDKLDEIIVTESFNGGGDVSGYNYDGRKVLSFSAFAGPFYSGVKTAVGDVNGDGTPEIVAVPERVGISPDQAGYKYISVDLASQTLFRFQNGLLLDKFLISSGKASTPTPAGSYEIFKKRPLVRMSWYFGPDNPQNYDLPNVPWVASFSGPYTIHGTYWHNNFGHPMSHGCVNMKTPEAKVVYDWAEIGTPIVIN